MANETSGIRIHPRTRLTNQARADVSDAVRAAVGKYDLTYGELLWVMTQEMSAWAAYQVRDERETPAVLSQDPGAQG